MRNLIIIVFDSARFDSVVQAQTSKIQSIGEIERRWSYASWTLPSHVVLLTGLLPHKNSPGTLASAVYRNELMQWARRLGNQGAPEFRFDRFVPHLSLPKFLSELGYRCEAFVSMPVLNENTIIGNHFRRFELMPQHNNLNAIIDNLTFDETPRFYFVNTGETHYPYLLPNESSEGLPRLFGVHGTCRVLDQLIHEPDSLSANDSRVPFTLEQLVQLRNRQVRCVEYLDNVIGRLLKVAPPNTYFIITSDHGELFGEGGYFGHGPVIHEKVFEVFLVEGVHPNAENGKLHAAITDSQISDVDDEISVLSRLKALGYL